jgi:hypothetical protein
MNQLNKIILYLFILSLNSVFSQILQLNLEVGKSYKHTNKITTNLVEESFGNFNEYKMNMEGEISFLVKDKQGELYEIEANFDRIRVSTSIPGMDFVIDSDSIDKSNVFSLIMNRFTKENFSFSMNQSGFIENINMDNLFNNVFNDFPEIPKSERLVILYNLKQSFGEQTFKGSIEMITAIFSPHPVNLNDKWTNKIKLVSNGSATTLHNEFQLIEYNDEYAVIEGTSKAIQDDDNNPFVKENEELVRNSMNGTMTSKIKIDAKSGWIIESNIEQDFDGLIEKKRKEDSKLILKIPISMKNTHHIQGN